MVASLRRAANVPGPERGAKLIQRQNVVVSCHSAIDIVDQFFGSVSH
jgi:hypothetical protein